MTTSLSTEHISEIKGRLYSGNVTEIRRKLEFDLTLCPSLIIEISKIEEIDMSGVFMLYSLKEKAKEKGSEVNFKGTENQVFKSALKFLGISHKFDKAAA